MSNADLYSPGTKLSEIPLDFRGIQWREFRNRQIAEQCNAHLKTLDRDNAPLARQAIHTKRDDYGHKSAGSKASIATLA